MISDPSNPRFLHWKDVRSDALPVHVARLFFRAGTGFDVHTHDFAEVYWCESGEGIHRINGVDSPVRTGDITFIRPHDRHGAVSGSAGMTHVNIAFAVAAMAPLAARYPEWPWHAGDAPLRARLSPQQIQRLSEWADDLAVDGVRQLDLDGFLTDLARLVTRPSGHDPTGGLPIWLSDALGAFADPRNLAGGTARLAQLCERSQEHINRVVRAQQGRTTTDLINELRMRWAATELRLGNRSITDIALTCGLDHLGHFYRLFRERFGMTPRGYRLQARRVAQNG